MVAYAIALAPLVLSVTFLVWSGKARPRIRYNGTEEPHSTFVVRRGLLVFEGVGFLLCSALIEGVLLLNGPPLLVNLMGYAVIAVLIVPILVTLLYPGVMSGRY